RVLVYNDAARQTRLALAALEQHGYVRRADAADRDALIGEATMAALTQFDESMRDLALQRYREFERELGSVLTRFVVEDTIRRFRAADLLHWAQDENERTEIDRLIEELTPQYGSWLSKHPALEDVTKLTRAVAQRLAEKQALLLATTASALQLRESL